ncbi:site-specific integrase [Nocardia sp. NBC_01377]|uniref:site-specific integrase n=1 Tax=Nocardia sp. NBC_01377 TaxID=2903595 RepID=UPI0038653F43
MTIRLGSARSPIRNGLPRICPALAVSMVLVTSASRPDKCATLDPGLAPSRLKLLRNATMPLARSTQWHQPSDPRVHSQNGCGFGQVTGAVPSSISDTSAAGQSADRPESERRQDHGGDRLLPHLHMHPHLLRHTFVTTLLDAGVELRDVQIAARHADPRTTG